MIKTALAAIGLAGAAVGLLFVYNLGVMHEKEHCDARVALAIANFEKLQTDVSKLVDDFATEAEKQTSQEEKTSAEKLKMVLERHRQAAGQKCAVSPATADADRSLRRNPKGSVPGTKR